VRLMLLKNIAIIALRESGERRKKMSKKVVILRGPSGSGKSTYINKHLPDAFVCSADHYFNDEEGNYNFDPTKLGQAHGSCRLSFKQAILDNVPVIVVDNTNTKLKEMEPYLDVARNHDYEIEVVRLKVPLDKLYGRNTHGVPDEAVKRMNARMQDYPGEKVVEGI